MERVFDGFIVETHPAEGSRIGLRGILCDGGEVINGCCGVHYQPANGRLSRLHQM